MVQFRGFCNTCGVVGDACVGVQVAGPQVYPARLPPQNRATAPLRSPRCSAGSVAAGLHRQVREHRSGTCAMALRACHSRSADVMSVTMWNPGNCAAGCCTISKPGSPVRSRDTTTDSGSVTASRCAARIRNRAFCYLRGHCRPSAFQLQASTALR